MRTMMVGLLLVALTPTVFAQNASSLDDPIPGEFLVSDPRAGGPCHIGAAVDDIAQNAHFAFGFQDTPDCWGTSTGLSPRALAASVERGGRPVFRLQEVSARRGLDFLMT